MTSEEWTKLDMDELILKGDEQTTILGGSTHDQISIVSDVSKDPKVTLKSYAASGFDWYDKVQL